MGVAHWRLVVLLLTQITTSEGVHRAMSIAELQHIFGVDNHDSVPNYVVDTPDKLYDDHKNHHYYRFNDGNVEFRFNIKPQSSFLSPAFHWINSDGNRSSLVTGAPSAACMYSGTATTHNHTKVALSGCGQKVRAFVMNGQDDYIIVQPLPPRFQTAPSDLSSVQRHKHVIYRRSSPDFVPLADLQFFQSEKPVCLYDELEDPYADLQFDEEDNGRLAVIKGSLFVELAVFADEKMWEQFKDIYGDLADAELMSFILACINNIDLLFSHSSLDPKIHLVITRYEVYKSAPRALHPSNHLNGNVDLLLESFCDYQNQINPADDSDPRHWDHALLFTGHDLYRGRLKAVAGYAPVKGICSGDRSCTINEGLDFGSVFVITHEMGHSLGMVHDGDNGCDRQCCIMSPSVGAGKTSWSTCSNNEFNRFINKLGHAGLPENCLLDDPQTGRSSNFLDHSGGGQLPGERYNLNQQCRIFHGDCWEQELRDGQLPEDVCDMLWCGAGEGVIRTSHPALEGSSCGNSRWCIEGKCVAWSPGRGPKPVNGEWTDWRDSPAETCGSKCSTCLIKGQLKLKRSVRFCENPPTNHGGRDCPGSDVRGIVCDTNTCSEGVDVNEFANNACTKLKTNPDIPNFLLSGTGFQYSESPCRIWCHMVTGSYIRAIGNYPDGVPCGTGKFCVKGLCQRLSCNDKAVVEHQSDCPSKSGLTPGVWNEWGAWSDCTRSCNGGVRFRARDCKSGSCSGSSRSSGICNTVSCEGFWGSWQSWGDCGVSCGRGRRGRHRECQGGSTCVGSRYEFGSCLGQSCPNATLVITVPDAVGKGKASPFDAKVETSAEQEEEESNKWSEWSDWSLCSVTCGDGEMTKTRQCKSSLCLGRSVLKENCSFLNCAEAEERLQTQVALTAGKWSEWAQWTDCTTKCGLGTKTRTRLCQPLGSRCSEGARETKGCHVRKCPRSRTSRRRDDGRGHWEEWSDWTQCSRSCGMGAKFRRRKCDGTGCKGRSIYFDTCTERSCSSVQNASPVLLRRFSGLSRPSWLP